MSCYEKKVAILYLASSIDEITSLSYKSLLSQNFVNPEIIVILDDNCIVTETIDIRPARLIKCPCSASFSLIFSLLKEISCDYIYFASNNYVLEDRFLCKMIETFDEDSLFVACNFDQINGRNNNVNFFNHYQNKTYKSEDFLSDLVFQFNKSAWDLENKLFRKDELVKICNIVKKTNLNKWLIFVLIELNQAKKVKTLSDHLCSKIKKYSSDDIIDCRYIEDEFSFLYSIYLKYRYSKCHKLMSSRAYRDSILRISKMMKHSDYDQVMLFVKNNLSKLFGNRIFDLRVLKARLVLVSSLILIVALHKRVIKKIHVISKLNKNKDLHFVMLGTPCHGNLGDQAIVAAERNFLLDIYKNASIIEFQTHEFYLCRNLIISSLKRYSVAIIDGGGNLGSLWKNENKRIIDILRDVRDSKIIMFPETVYYDNDSLNTSFVNHDQNVLMSANCLYCLRDKASYDFFDKYMPKTKHFFVPDIVYSLQKKRRVKHNNSVALIFRNDLEKTISQNNEDSIEMLLKKYNISFSRLSTISKHSFIPAWKRNIILNGFFKRLSKYNMVITDRLHGMIFSYINNVPCACVDNVSKKISGSYYWIADNDNYNVYYDINGLIQSLKFDTLAKTNSINKKIEFEYIRNEIVCFLEDIK